MFDQRCVVVGVTGGIAVYKTASLISLLKKQGAQVYVIMTKNAAEFVAPLTFEVLSGNPAITDTFSREAPWEVEHVTLAQKADLFIVAPATANFLGKAASGVADDMLLTTLLAAKCPVTIAPRYEYQHVQRRNRTAKHKSFKEKRLLHHGYGVWKSCLRGYWRRTNERTGRNSLVRRRSA